MPDKMQTDEQLLQQIQQGDKAAFRILFDRHYKTLLAVAVNMLKDVNAAKDATQDVFLQVWKKRESLNVKSAPIAYLKRAVINRALNQIKSRKGFVTEEHIVDMHSREPAANQTLEAQDVEKAMKVALDSLPERCRLVFVLRRLEGLSLKEIAAKLDISPKTAENQMTKALKVLKTAMQPFVEENSS